MVAVATQLDIPAKLLFPRPVGPGDDPSKRAMSMLGLGDVILPGMMIGFALRFDLYLFYLQKQTQAIKEPTSDEEDTEEPAGEPRDSSNMVKAKWRPATGMYTLQGLNPSIVQSIIPTNCFLTRFVVPINIFVLILHSKSCQRTRSWLL